MNLNKMTLLVATTFMSFATQDYGYEVAIQSPIQRQMIYSNRHSQQSPAVVDLETGIDQTMLSSTLYFTNELIGNDKAYASIGTDFGVKGTVSPAGLGLQLGLGTHITVMQKNKIAGAVYLGAVDNLPNVSGQVSLIRVLDDNNRVTLSSHASFGHGIDEKVQDSIEKRNYVSIGYGVSMVDDE